MRIRVLAVGKVKEKFYRQAIEEFQKRLSRYCKLEILEVADEKTPDRAGERTVELIKEREGERLLKHICGQDYVCALAIEGKQPDSMALADMIKHLEVGGTSSITFIIGGSLGLSKRVLKRADFLLSFSNLTFPHQLMRVLLLEQIYRSYRIISGAPYHK
ncbi:MAG: 23S rRNA (pseudouridine(1915)-N(3))-methyltransferase RlmH [Lachnospiraceae bacterium]|nr:23S rRNA (pseudouridine(1915)-N(3))-methyltransferase RlmH [Lachnospiraceae bacterium]